MYQLKTKEILDTGLRTRFFVVIFLLLTISVAFVSLVQNYFFDQERSKLLKLNLEQNALLISQSTILTDNIQGQKNSDRIISKIIGNDKINVIVATYSLAGEKLVFNSNAVLFGMPEKINTSFEKWEDIDRGEFLLKTLTIVDEKHNRIIKTGMVLNETLLRWKNLTTKILGFSFLMIIAFVLPLSLLATKFLLSPLYKIIEILDDVSENLDYLLNTDNNYIHRIKLAGKNKKDELHLLSLSLLKLTQKFHRSLLRSRKWSTFMAHEIKTPLARMHVATESLSDSEEKNELKYEIKHLDHIVNNFLDWASVDASSVDKSSLYAIKLSIFIEKILIDFKKHHQFDYNISISKKAVLACNPSLFELLISNIIKNSILHSRAEILKVSVEFSNNILVISDNGQGIPDDILKKFGMPFNKRHSKNNKDDHSTGIGLAWIKTVVDYHSWSLVLNSDGQGTVYEINTEENDSSDKKSI